MSQPNMAHNRESLQLDLMDKHTPMSIPMMLDRAQCLAKCPQQQTDLLPKSISVTIPSPMNARPTMNE
jgi:hypothetical protein